MELPSKDKFGGNYLSYSQISLFLKDKEQYKKQYILKEPFIGNEYTDFGLKIGKALEENDFSKFDSIEKNTLLKITRLDLFERKTILKYDGFYIIGFLDTCSNDLKTIIDYKTGGNNKEYQYSEKNYTQLVYYALSLRQETGITPTSASVEFIRREGNLFKNQLLKVSKEDPIKINIDITENRLKKVYWETIEIAKQISDYFKNN